MMLVLILTNTILVMKLVAIKVQRKYPSNINLMGFKFRGDK